MKEELDKACPICNWSSQKDDFVKVKGFWICDDCYDKIGKMYADDNNLVEREDEILTDLVSDRD